MSREVMKLALEALEYIYEGANNQGPHTGISWRCVSNKAKPAITALREALAEQPAQQEPVACLVETEQGVMLWPIEDINEAENFCEENEFPVLLYTSPPAQRTWVRLTDEDIRPMCKQDWVFDTVKQWAQIIEAKLREKNT